MIADVRWRQRFQHFERAYADLQEALELAATRPLSKLEKQGVIQGFEVTHELAWKLLKDYLNYQGEPDITGSRDSVRAAFKYELVSDGETWLAMIAARNLTSHAYNREIAEQILVAITTRYFPAFSALNETFQRLASADP